MNPSALVDTSVWIDYFRRPDSNEGDELDALLKRRAVSTCGVVMAEILQGSLNENEFEVFRERLKGLHYLETDDAAYVEAGRLSFALRKRGRTIPLTDALIAVLAIRYGQSLWTRDAHFRNIPGLKLK